MALMRQETSGTARPCPLQRRPSNTPRSSRLRSNRLTEAKYIGIWLLLFLGSCFEVADVLCCVESPTPLQHTIIIFAILVPIFIAVVGLACLRRESPLHQHLCNATFIQLVLYLITFAINAYANHPIFAATLVAVQLALVLLFLFGARFYASPSETAVAAIRPWFLALVVLAVRVAWRDHNMSRDTLSDATYIISATLPASFSCYIAMIWLTTTGYRLPWRFWQPQEAMNVRNCQWLSLLAMQALVGTIFGTMIAVTNMVANEIELLAAIAIAILLVGVVLMWFSADQVWGERETESTHELPERDKAPS